MSQVSSAPGVERNAFLTALPAAEYELLQSHLVPFEFRAGDLLHKFGEPIEAVVFPHSGVVAMSVRLPNNARAGALLVGRDGIIGGFAAAASARAICDAEVQIAGTASRMSAVAFRDVLDESQVIRRLMARFDAVMLAQAQQTALCNAVHPVDARLCRWLLEFHDRVADSRVPLTQATLAQLLGVRRTTVTLMAGRLEAAGVLNCRRGAMQIADRSELQRRSCECYDHLKNYQADVLAKSTAAAASAAEGSTPSLPGEAPGWARIRTAS